MELSYLFCWRLGLVTTNSALEPSGEAEGLDTRTNLARSSGLSPGKTGT
jgi:hypothetical protein